jgi:hypothetical protein
MITGIATLTVKDKTQESRFEYQNDSRCRPFNESSFGGRPLIDAEQLASLKSARHAVHHPIWTARGAIVLACSSL